MDNSKRIDLVLWKTDEVNVSLETSITRRQRTAVVWYAPHQ